MPQHFAQIVARYIPFGVPLISIFIALPLVLRKVPPNLWYGFRTRRTLSDPDIWYRANYLGGICLLYANIAAFTVNLVLDMLFPSPLAMPIQMVVLVIATGLGLLAWVRRMRDI